MIASRQRPLRALVLLTVLAIVAAACGSSSGKTGSGGSSSGPVPKGGTITIGAEQEPTCFDWLGTCSASAWGFWIAQVETVPQAYLAVPKNGTLVSIPGPVLAGPATMTTTPVETVRYKINPAAVWSDGVAITCADFAYTVDQEKNDSDIYDTTGYTGIDKVTCPDPKSVVVTFASGQTYADWANLFSGAVGVLPSHLLKGKKRNAAMRNGYTWSGGPWFAKWTKGDSVVLTPNPKYWDKKPNLDKVVFKFETDTAAEFQAFQSGQVDAIYPQPEIDVVDAIKAGLTDANSQYNANTATVEALWLNVSKPPFDSLAVRRALGYAMDRNQIVVKLFGKLGVKHAANSLNSTAVAAYSNQNAWAKYKLDLGQVNSILTADGWSKSGGFWTKGGKRLSFTVQTTAGDKRRELTEQVMQQELKTAGFDMKIDNPSADDLFAEKGPIVTGTYQATIFGLGLTTLSPGLCSQFCTKNIPGPANQNSGQNTQWVSNPALDKLLETVDTSLDDATRKAAAKKADDLMADQQVSLPLDPLPDILIWKKTIVGPVTDNPILGMFWNINEWGLKK